MTKQTGDLRCRNCGNTGLDMLGNPCPCGRTYQYVFPSISVAEVARLMEAVDTYLARYEVPRTKD